jgi:hypothetical protein
MSSQHSRDWQDVVKTKRHERDQLLKPYIAASLTQQEQDIILSADARTIVDGVSHGKFSASVVTLAHIKQ